MEPINPHVTNWNLALRLVTVLGWIPAFALLLPYKISGGSPIVPTLGIVPITFSALVGLVHLAGKAKYRYANIFLDLFCAAFLIGILIPGWILMADGWEASAGLTMLGTYGTIPLMVNL